MASIRTFTAGISPAACDHPYLAFERLIPDNHVEGDGKRQHQAAALQRKLPEALRDTYTRAFNRRYKALNGFQGGMEDAVTKFFSVQVQGRLAAGLGNASVLENGLSLNHTFGLPYLPGTGLKGMASAMAHLGLESKEWKRGTEKDGKWVDQGADHKVLFGTMDTGAEDATAGMVIFHDAWWDPEPEPGKPEADLPFQLDVMTPHHQKYNLEGGDWPNDWESPIPVPYVTTGGTFRLALTGPEAWVEAAFEILQMAFKHLGFGAKTQIGYGRGEFILSAEEQAAKEARKAESKRLNDEAEARKKEIDRLKGLADAKAKEAERLAELPKEGPAKGIIKPLKSGGKLQALFEIGGWKGTMDKDVLKGIAPELAEKLWERLEKGREAKILATLVIDGSTKKLFAVSLTS